MFGISGEHLLVLGIVLLIFGPRRLPELGNTLGKCVKNFKDALAGVEEAKFHRIEDQPSKSGQTDAGASASSSDSKPSSSS